MLVITKISHKMTPTTLNDQQLIQQPGQISTYRKRKYQNSAASDNDFSDVSLIQVNKIERFVFQDESSPKTSSPSVDDDKVGVENFDYKN